MKSYAHPTDWRKSVVLLWDNDFKSPRAFPDLCPSHQKSSYQFSKKNFFQQKFKRNFFQKIWIREKISENFFRIFSKNDSKIFDDLDKNQEMPLRILGHCLSIKLLKSRNKATTIMSKVSVTIFMIIEE